MLNCILIVFFFCFILSLYPNLFAFKFLYIFSCWIIRFAKHRRSQYKRNEVETIMYDWIFRYSLFILYYEIRSFEYIFFSFSSVSKSFLHRIILAFMLTHSFYSLPQCTPSVQMFFRVLVFWFLHVMCWWWRLCNAKPNVCIHSIELDILFDRISLTPTQ